MRRSFAALLCCLLLFGCAGRQKDASSSSSALPSSASSSEEEKELSSSEEDSRAQGPYLAPLSVSGPQGASLDSLFDDYYGTVLPIREESSFRFTFAPGTTLNFLRLSPIGRCGVRVTAGERVLYDANMEASAPLPKEGLSGGIVCRFDDTAGETFTLTVTPLEEGVCLDETAFGMLEKSLPVSAYLPASTAPAALEEYRESLPLLGRVSVITGTCWDQDGRAQVIDQNYPALLAALTELRKESGFSILSTFYPARELVRAGTAGESVSTPERRAALIGSLIDHCGQYALDGIDLDWETPKDETEWAGYSALICEAAAAFKERGLLLSAALYPDDCVKLTSDAIRALPALHLMAYDQFDKSGRHTTYEGAYQAAALALGAGFSPGQLTLGIPAYGRPLDQGMSWPLYRDAGLGYTENQKDGAYYNSPALARDKTAFAALEGLGGVFLYHLTGDLPAGDPLSLLRSLI